MTAGDLVAQRAFEALRNGVPNADAVRALGCMQPEPLDRFRDQLSTLAAAPADADPPVVAGTLLMGGFGSGKSHTLGYFAQEALDRGFVVSRLVISKETPLHDRSKLFLAAVREARIPDTRGALVPELALRVRYEDPALQPFLKWVNTQPSGMLAASMTIHERSADDELRQEVENWWAGEKLGVPAVRAGLRQLGLARAFEVRAVRAADLAGVRFEFLSRFIRALGFAGWVLLLDEVELVGRYSLLQRAKSYAELAHWLGAGPDDGVGGVTCVAAITDDFDFWIDQKADGVKTAAKLRQRGDDRLGRAAERGVEQIRSKGLRLHPPSDDSLAATFEKLKELYRQAYGSTPTSAARLADDVHRPMRSYVRRWISEWDLERLYPGQARATEEDELPKATFEEDPDLAPRDSSPAGDP